MLEQINYDTYDQDVIRNWVGNGASNLVKRALKGNLLVDDFIEDEKHEEALKIFLDYYEKNLCQNTYLFDGVKDTLVELKKNGYLLTIVTNKPYEFIDPILDGLGLKNIFEISLGGNSLEKKKPNPMPLLHLCKMFELSEDEVVMVGDSKNDIEAANNAHMQSIAVTYGYNHGENIEVHNPTVIIDNFKDLLEVL